MAAAGGRILPLADGEGVLHDVLQVPGGPPVHAANDDLIFADIGAADDLAGGQHLCQLQRLIGGDVVVERVETGRRGVRVQPVAVFIEQVDVVVGLHLAQIERLVPLQVETPRQPGS